jgi:Flp pilus assembly protein TadD
MHLRAILALAGILCAPPPAKSQLSNSQEAAVVKGEVETGQPIAQGYTIQLYDTARSTAVVTSDVRSDGEFEFHHTPYGSYLVTVTNGHGDPVYQGNFTVGGIGEPFIIRLPKEEVNRPISGTISVTQLRHPPSRKAFKMVLEAQALSESGHFAEAAASLQKAVALSPDYADAWVNLAAQHLRLGSVRQAVDETRHAIELAGPTTVALCNLAYGEALLGRNQAAREASEQAVHLTPDDPRANYILGLILFITRAGDAEAARHLRLAASTFDGARATLAKIEAK